MNYLNAFVYVGVYMLVVCPINDVYSQAQTPISTIRGRFAQRGNTATSYKRTTEKPCTVCPRHGRCVPKIQCPAHIRPGSFNPECHLNVGNVGTIGICCFTGSGHAAESDHKRRSASSIAVQDMKAAHHQSQLRLADLKTKETKLMKNPLHTTVNITSPSHYHHLSMVTHDDRADEIGRAGLHSLFAAQELRARQAISDDDLSLGLTDLTGGPGCPPPPSCPEPPSRYRSIGGDCNNLANVGWGSANSPFERLLPPDYSDGTWGLRGSISGLPLPSARSVSSVLVPEGSHLSATHNMLFVQFGQFIAHDISAGVVFTLGNGSAISCCANEGKEFLPTEFQHWGCAPVSIDSDDVFYGQYQIKCLNFVRTQLAPSSDCSVGYAKQMNGATHFPDLSHLYGSTEKKLTALRAPDGLLDVFNDYGRELPPLTKRDECVSVQEGAACFESGDNHGNQIITLTVLHTIWTREHNRIARALARLNPAWDEERIFWEARRIVQAEFQHVIYNEWLPLLLGPHLPRIFDLKPSEGYCSAYDQNSNPSLTSEFAAAAMRFGHSVVDGKINIPNPSTNVMFESISIPELMFQPSRLRLKHFLDRSLIGLTQQPMQSVDPFVTEGLTKYLFHGGNPFGFDLAAINIQRGRDWGVRSYNHYRRLIGMPPFEDFSQFSPNTAQRLSAVYTTPEDIDLWVGGLLEEPFEGSVVGITFAHILADQFSRLKKGDRYFYENGPDVNPGAFTPSQLAEVKKVTLARVLCDNSDGFEAVAFSPSAFLRADLPGNEPLPCDALPSLDLNRFKEF